MFCKGVVPLQRPALNSTSPILLHGPGHSKLDVTESTAPMLAAAKYCSAFDFTFIASRYSTTHQQSIFIQSITIPNILQCHKKSHHTP